uniref:Calneuron 1 n=4 Tax=Felidae TaxID=9681 RepID=A0ABI7Y204_FELCA
GGGRSGELSNTEKQQFAGVNVGSFFGEEKKEDRLPSSSSPPACVPVCAVRVCVCVCVCVCASVSARAPRRSSGCAAWKPREPLERRRGGGGGSPSLGAAGARVADASPGPRLLSRPEAERGRRCGRPPGPGGPAGEEPGRRPELHGVSRARNSGGASATGLRGAARQPRTWAEPARRGSARPAGAGGVEERAVPGCGARVPRREQRTRTGRSVPGSRSEPTRGSRRPGARLGSGPGRRGSRRQRGCRRGDAAAGWGCERQAERCPPAPAAAPPPPCGPRRKPPAPRGGASEPGLRGSGPRGRPRPSQREKMPFHHVTAGLLYKGNYLNRSLSAGSDSEQLANISVEELDEIREAFRVLDRDGNGFISKQELGMAMRSLGYMPSEVELAIIMQRLDMDGDGQVDFDEFMTILGPKLVSSEGRDGFLGNTIDSIFWQFDMQRITLEELKHILYHAFRDHLTMKDIENIIINEEESLQETSENCQTEFEGVHAQKQNRQTCVRKSLICAFAMAFIISVMLIAANQILRSGME